MKRVTVHVADEVGAEAEAIAEERDISVSPETVDPLVATADQAFRILWMDTASRADRAARLAHGEGLSRADALVLMGALDTKVSRLYTGDSDLLALDGFESLDIIEV